MKNIFLVIGALLVAPFSFAQIDTSSTQAIIQGIVKGAPGATTNGIGTGAVVTRAGQVLVPASGLKIPVPISIAANVGKGRILAGALGCSTVLTAALCAATAAQVIVELKNAAQGYKSCPAGDASFICRSSAPSGGVTVQPSMTGWGPPSIWGASGTTLQAECGRMINAVSGGQGSSYPFQYALWQAGGVYADCYAQWPTDGHVGKLGTIARTDGAAYTADRTASADEMSQTLQERMNADYQANRRLYEALKRDQADAISTGRPWADTYNPVDSETGVTVTAPPVTTPERTVSTKTRTLPNGETETEVKKEVTTVTPVTSGTKVGDSATKYITSTVITTTVTNNTTNITNTSTETVTDEVPEEPPPNECPPNTTLAKCSTLGQIPEKEVIPSQDVPVTYTPVSFQSSASCPSGVGYEMGSMGGSKVISYQPMCDWLSAIRPLFLALGALACAWVFMESLKS